MSGETVTWYVCCGSDEHRGHRIDCKRVNPVRGSVIDGEVVTDKKEISS